MTRSCSAIGWLLVVGVSLLGLRSAPAAEEPGESKQASAEVSKKDDHGHDHEKGDAGHAVGETHDEAVHGEVDHGDHEHHATVRGEPHGRYGKLPEFLYIDPILFLWTLGLFIVTYVILSQLAWKPILAALKARDDKIAESQKQAEEARAQAQELIEQHKKEVGRAHQEAKDLLENARNEATKDAESVIAKSRQKADEAQANAEKEIEEAKQKALAEVRSSAVRLAAEAAGKVVGKEFSSDGLDGLVEEASS